MSPTQGREGPPALHDTGERQRRMEALTRVARTVSHDYNNLIAAIQSNTEQLRERLEPLGNQHDIAALDQLTEAAALARDLTHQLQAFTENATAIQEPRSLSFVVDMMGETLSAACSASTRLDLSLDAELPSCPVAEDLVRTALLNIVTNACDSLAGEPGTVWVRTYVRDGHDVDPGDVFLLADLQPTGYACLEVTNDGPAVSSDNREHLFDPCFSTRIRATGLGLSAVMGTMRTHRGCIEVPLRQKGFTLRLLFPLR